LSLQTKSSFALIAIINIGIHGNHSFYSKPFENLPTLVRVPDVLQLKHFPFLIASSSDILPQSLFGRFVIPYLYLPKTIKKAFPCLKK